MAVSRLSQQSLQQAFPKGNTFWDGTTATSAFDSLGSVLLGATNTSITFTNIPQGYTHLQLRYYVLGVSLNDDLQMQFNGDTSANYSRHWVGGNGSTGNASFSANSTFAYAGLNATVDGYAAIGIVDIHDYTSTVKAKTSKVFCGSDRNSASTGVVYMASNSWTKNTSSVYEAISTLRFYTGGSTNMIANTRVSLYGVK
jgi:hypothetical protein